MLTPADYRRNFVVDTLDYAFFSLGMAFGSVFTLLPLFARNLGATNLQIGLIPAITYLGWSLPALWGGRYSNRLERKLPFILKATLGERLPYLGFSFLAFALAGTYPDFALYLLLIFLGISSFTMGFLSPIWTEMIGKVINPARRGSYFAVGNGLGALMGMGGSRLAEKIIATHAFPQNFGFCFLLASGAMAISYFFLALTREEKGVVGKEQKGYFRSLWSLVKRDTNFAHFLLARIFLAMGIMGGSFYTVHTLQNFSIPDNYIARYNAFFLVFQALSNFIWGPLGDRKGHKSVLIIGSLSVIFSNLIAFLAQSPAMFLLAFALFGVNYSAINVGGVAILLDFAPVEKRGDYLGLGTFIAGFPAFFAPLVGGKVADGWGYPSVFLIALILNAVGFLCLLGVKEPKTFEDFS